MRRPAQRRVNSGRGTRAVTTSSSPHITWTATWSSRQLCRMPRERTRTSCSRHRRRRSSRRATSSLRPLSARLQPPPPSRRGAFRPLRALPSLRATPSPPAPRRTAYRAPGPPPRPSSTRRPPANTARRYRHHLHPRAHPRRDPRLRTRPIRRCPSRSGARGLPHHHRGPPNPQTRSPLPLPRPGRTTTPGPPPLSIKPAPPSTPTTHGVDACGAGCSAGPWRSRSSRAVPAGS